MEYNEYLRTNEPKIDHIGPCGTPHMMGTRGRGRDTVVVFNNPGYTNSEPIWVCSSGHCSDYDLIPNLRRCDMDPIEWFKNHSKDLYHFIKVDLCDAHAPMGSDDVPPDDTWGQDGHLWTFNNETLFLCLPRA